MLARVQYSEGPATGHLDTGFSWFPRVFMCDGLLPPGVNRMCDVLLPPGVNRMCDVLLPPGVNPTAVKYIYISYHIISYTPIHIISPQRTQLHCLHSI
jgi:hypothetical protein